MEARTTATKRLWRLFTTFKKHLSLFYADDRLIHGLQRCASNAFVVRVGCDCSVVTLEMTSITWTSGRLGGVVTSRNVDIYNVDGKNAGSYTVACVWLNEWARSKPVSDYIQETYTVPHMGCAQINSLSPNPSNGQSQAIQASPDAAVT